MISLWLPIIAAAVGVFIASSITHMVLPYHRTDVRKLPGDQEDVLLEAYGGARVADRRAGGSLTLAFHFGSLIALLAYGMALPQHSIWYRRSWATTFKSLFDSLIYGLVTGGAFAWLWPNVS